VITAAVKEVTFRLPTDPLQAAGGAVSKASQ